MQHNVTIVRVDDPTALPLSNTATANPNDTVVGVQFLRRPRSGRGRAQYGARLGGPAIFQSGGHQVTNPRFRCANPECNGLAGHRGFGVDDDHGDVVDGGFRGAAVLRGRRESVYGHLRGDRTRDHGLRGTDCGQQRAGRRSFEADHVSNAPTPVGDATRPNFIYNQLVNATSVYSPRHRHRAELTRRSKASCLTL